MLPRPTLRLPAAAFAICLGTAHIASLWFRELDQEAVWSLLLGTVYLFVGLGLCGRSRLALFLAVAVPCAAAALRLHDSAGQFTLTATLQLATDAAMATLGATALWRSPATGTD